MSNTLSLNTDTMHIVPYTFQFVDSALIVKRENNPTTIVMHLDGNDALDLVDWLSLHRKALIEAVMRNDVEARSCSQRIRKTGSLVKNICQTKQTDPD